MPFFAAPLPPQASKPAAVPPVAAPRTARELHHYDLLDSRFRIKLDPARRRFTGSVVHTLRTTVRDNATLLFDAGRMTIRAVRLNGKSVPVVHRADLLTVVSALKKGTQATIQIDYEAQPETGMYFVPANRAFPAPGPSVYTQGEMEDTRYWLPTYDFPNDKATSEGLYEVPAGWNVLGNGRLLGVTKSQTRWTYRWKMDRPHSTYLTSMVAGPYTEIADGDFKGKPMSIWVPEGLESWAKPTFGGTDRIVALYSRLTGTDYPWPKYAQSAVPDFLFGGMENISATTQTLSALYPASVAETSSAFGLNAHELAHQWFGDLVTTPNWSHIWINEGWASFLPHFAVRDRDGENAYQIERVGTLTSAAGAGRSSPNRPMVWKGFREPLEMFDGYAYAGGAARMFALMHEVGEPKFWRATQTYLAQYGGKNVDTDAFFASYAKSLGRDLNAFKRQWFYTNSVPNIRARRVAGGTSFVQNVPGFAIEVDVKIIGSGIARRKKIALRPDRAVLLPHAPDEIVLPDPGRWLVATVDYGADLSPEQQARLIPLADNAGARADLVDRWFGSLSPEIQAGLYDAERVPLIRERMASNLKDPERLLALTFDSDPRIALNAVRALGTKPKTDPIVARLTALRAGSPNDTVRGASLNSLLNLTKDANLAEDAWADDASFDAGDSVTVLNYWRANRPERARNAALQTLDISPSISLLTTALNVLGEVKDLAGSRTVYEAIVRRLDDPSVQMRIAAINALGAYGDPAATPLLTERLASSNIFVRMAARQATTRLASPK